MHTTRAWHSPRRRTRSDSHCSGASHNSLHLTFFFAPSIGCMPCSRFQTPFFESSGECLCSKCASLSVFQFISISEKNHSSRFLCLATLFYLSSSHLLSTYKLSSDSLPTLFQLSSNSLLTLFQLSSGVERCSGTACCPNSLPTLF